VEGSVRGPYTILAFVGGLRETIKDLSLDSQSPGRESNPGSLEYEAEVLNTQLLRSEVPIT